MALNKQKGNMYGFVTHTWNTIKGKCPHNCSYCYMKRFPQPELHFDEKELKTNLGENNFIFVGSSCDMFADSIPSLWIEKTLEHCVKTEMENKFLFQSKNPERFYEFRNKFPVYSTLCTTIETTEDKYFNLSGGQKFNKRIESLINLSEIYPIMLTIEPVIDFDLDDFVYWLEILDHVIQVNIGADSGNNNLPEPSKEKIFELIKELEKFTKVYQKPNLKRLLR